MLVLGPYRLEPADRPDGQQLGGSFCPAGEVRPILGAQPLALHLHQKRACLSFIVSSDLKSSGQPLQQVVRTPGSDESECKGYYALRGAAWASDPGLAGLGPGLYLSLFPTYVGARSRNVPPPVK